MCRLYVCMYVYCLSFMGGVVCGAGVWLFGGWWLVRANGRLAS